MANPTLLTPLTTTLGDICAAALRRCGYIGVGQTALAEDLTDTWADLQWMLQSWSRKRWFIYHLVDLSIVSTGQLTPYTVGPGAQIDTGTNSDRPNRLEAAYLRQLTQGSPNNIDYPMEILQSMEDWSRVRLKTLSSFPQFVFFDSSWPNGGVRFWPVPQANIYEIHIIVRAQLPVVFLTQASTFSLPFEYYEAIVWNVALSACPRYGIMPNPVLAMKAKTGLEMLRTGNTQIATLSTPPEVNRNTLYNIFGDISY